MSKKATVNLAKSSSPVIHDDSDNCLSDTVLNSNSSNPVSMSQKTNTPFLPQELPLPSTTSKNQKKSVVYVQSLIGDRVAEVLCGTTHFGTILFVCIWDDRKNYWEIVYDNNFDEEEVDTIVLSTRQKLYHLRVEKDIV